MKPCTFYLSGEILVKVSDCYLAKAYLMKLYYTRIQCQDSEL
jgi:hypothetical protein